MIRKGIHILSGLLCIFVFLAVLCPFSADASAPEVKTVRVGFFQMDGYHMQDESGHRSGYGYEFLQKIKRYLPYRYEYVGYDKSWDEMLTMLENGEIDILTSAAKTPEREERFEYSRSVIGVNTAILTVKAGNTRLVTKDYATYDGARIGFLSGSSKIAAFRKYAQENNFSYEAVYYNGFDEMESALQAGVIDAIAGANLRSIDREWVLDQFDQNAFYVIAAKGNRAILDEIDHAIEKLDQDEPGWRTAMMYGFYFSDAPVEFALQADEQAYFDSLRENQVVLKVLTNPDRRPYSYFQIGEAKGIFPAVFAKLAEKIGFEYEILVPASSKEYFELLDSGVADIYLDAPFDFSNGEKRGYILTDAYMSTGISQLSRTDFSGQVHTVALMENAILTHHYAEQYFPGAEFKYYDAPNDCVSSVSRREADVTLLYNLTAQDILNHDYLSRYKSILLDSNCISIAFGVREDCDPRLVQVLNRCVNALHDTEISSIIIEETEEFQESLSLLSFLRRNPLYLGIIIIILSVLLMVICIAYISLRDAKRLKRLNAELEYASNAKQEFLTKISHDMRTPMNAIIGFADIALKQNDLQEAHKCLEKISSSSEHLLTLINDVMDIRRIEKGVETYNPTPTDICAVTDSVLSVIQGLLSNRKLTFKVDRPEDEHCCVMTDGARIQEILINLLSNAVKFTDDGGTITFSIGLRPGADNLHGTLWYCISDTGCGMSEDFLPHIYEYFTQEEKSARTQYKGSGLGLSITKHYVELMGGTIAVHSKKGVGTTFTVELPVEVLGDAVGENQQSETPVHADLSGKHVLMAEDNDLNAEIAIYLLEEIRMSITRAVDGKQAVSIFADNPAGTFDLILMDIMMPEMNGYEATQAIRSMADRPDGGSIPIIAMTANAFAEDVQASLDVGMNAHIAKPLNVDDVVKTIARCLGK